jgi:hypothetical protein
MAIPLLFPAGTAKPATLAELIALGLSVGTASVPAFTIRSWNPVLSRFEALNPAVTVAALAAGVPGEFTVAAQGRLIMAELTVAPTAGEAVALLASGYEIDHTL